MERGMTERTRKLRKQSTTTKPSISIERAKLMTEVYEKYEGSVETPVLRGLALKYIMENRTLCINEDELIIGEKGEGPQSAPTFPELCCHTVSDLDVMNSREIISFNVSDEVKETHISKVIPYWENRSLRKKILDNISDDWKTCYESGMFTEFMEQRAPGHTVADGKMYHKGFLDFKEDIKKSIEKLDFENDLLAFDKKAELEGMDLCCDAMIILGERYAKLAREMAQKEVNEKRKSELLLIAENCEIVPANAPKTFYQALQMYWFIHIAVTTELNNWDAFSPGRLDQHLNPFYEREINDGTLTKDKAKEFLECLWIKFNNQPAPPKVGITLKESSTYADFANINTGGINENGQDGVNEISYMIMDVMEEMKLIQPSSNVQISKKTPHKFLLRACEVSRRGWGQPAIYNTDAIVQELLNAGKTIEDARQGGCSGCVETGAFGKEAYILTGYLNIPKILEITLNNGYDPISGKQIGLKTGAAEEFKSYEQLFEAFKKQMNYFVGIKIKGNNIIEKLYSVKMPAPLLSILVDDCISNGKDYNAGGARYNTNYIQGVGIATISDSLAAIKYNVFDEKKFTINELMDALKNNFEGYDIIKNRVTNRTPKYGNDNEYADGIMKEVFNAFYEEVTGRPTVRGGRYRIQMLPTTCHVYFGDVMGASANGRLAHKPLSEGISPEKGADTNGPTAVIKSCSKMEHLKTGGTLLNQKFSPSVVAGEKGLENLASLVKAYFTMDGHHIQFNIIDKQILLNAQKNPEEYKDLIVRVAGYSDHFNNLSKALQDEIIERTEQKFN